MTVHLQNGTGGPEVATLTFAPPTGQEWTPRTYDAAPLGQGSPSQAGVAFSYQGAECAQPTGRLGLMDADPTQHRLWLTYEVHCGGSMAAVFGEVRINESVMDRDVSLDADHIAWPASLPGYGGREVDVTVVNTSQRPLTFSDVAITSGMDDFAVQDNGCLRTLERQSLCRIGVKYKPSSAGTHTGTLTLNDSAGSGTQTVQLSGALVEGHTTWQVHSQADNPIAPAGDYSDQFPDWVGGGVWYGTTNHEIYISLYDRDGHAWQVTFFGDEQHPLVSGATYTSSWTPGDSDTSPPQVQINAGQQCDAFNSFTIHQAVYDDQDVLTRLSATFTQRCFGHRGAMMGSVTWDATDPAAALPPVPAPPAPPGPVQGFTADASIGMVNFDWQDPSDPDLDNGVLCDQPGTRAMRAPTDYCLEDDGVADGHAMFGASPSGTQTWTLWPRDVFGSLGEPRSVTTRGTLISVSSGPASSGASTGLRLDGHLTDASSHSPLVGVPVELYATRVKAVISEGDTGGRRDDVLVAVVTTNALGNFTRTFPLRPGWDYQARFEGRGTQMGNLTQLVPGDGSSYIDLSAQRAPAGRSASVRLTAKVSSAHRGDKVLFQRLVKRHWRKLVLRKVGTSGVAVTRTRATGKAGTTYRALLVPAGNGQRRASVPLRVQAS